MAPPAETPSAEHSDVPAGATVLVERARLLARREKMFAGSPEALLMVSGGQDSLALLHLLATGGLRTDGPGSVRALHVNHHLRGEESEADEALVRRHCAALGVPLHVHHAPVDKRAGNVQATARRARRAAAAEGRRAAAVVVLGHTLDDQVETMLYRLGRYGGLPALAAMSPVDPPWVRPLLTCRRAHTEAYCRAQRLDFAVDRGNEYPGYARTGLRTRVVPIFEEVLPGAVEAAGRAAEVAREALEIVRDTVEAAEASVRSGPALGELSGKTAYEMSVPRLLALSIPVRRALLHEVLRSRLGREVDRAVVLEVEALLEGGGSAEKAVGGDWVALRSYDRLTLLSGRPHRSGARPLGTAASSVEASSTAPDSPPSAPPVPLACPGEVRVGALVVRASPAEHFRAHDPRSEAYLDAAACSGHLWVRTPAPGDRMRPLGAPGRRLVHDILIDMKVPRALRSRVPVVGCGDRIVWLGGFAVAEEGRISPTTTRLVHLKVKSADEENRVDGPGDGAGTL